MGMTAKSREVLLSPTTICSQMVRSAGTNAPNVGARGHLTLKTFAVRVTVKETGTKEKNSMELTVIEKIEEYKDSEAVDYLESALEDLREKDQEHGVTIQCLNQALGHMDMVRSNLLSALSHSNPVEAILIQQGLESLAKTRNLVDSIKNAMEANK
jgi:hypothetical protein